MSDDNRKHKIRQEVYALQPFVRANITYGNGFVAFREVRRKSSGILPEILSLKVFAYYPGIA